MSINETIYETTMMDAYVDEEEHIVVDENRKITVPENLKTIAVQGDKDIETVTIDCIRNWDGNDLSTFIIYINCELPNGDEVAYIPEEIIVNNNDYFSFKWIIGREITPYAGKLKFSIVAKIIDDNGNDIQQWSSLQNDDLLIARGGGEIYVPSVDQEKDEFLKNINQLRIVESNEGNNNVITNPDEAHIVVERNRAIFVPDNLKTIAVKGDKNVETVTIDCIKYWDGKDLSEFVVFINYTLPNGENGTYIPDEIIVKESVFSFNWVIGRHITSYVGSLTFWILAKLTDDDGNLIHQWSSFQNTDCFIAQGGGKIYVPEEQTDKDVISQIISTSKKSAERAESAAELAEKSAELAVEAADKLITEGGGISAEVERRLTALENDTAPRFTTDKTLTLKEGVLSVNMAKEDRTLPISAADVDVTVGNIEVLLKTI